MKSRRSSLSHPDRRSLWLGVLGGACLAFLVGGFFWGLLRTARYIITAPQRDRITQAQQALDAGYPEEVKELLWPMVTEFDPPEQVKAYELLGKAESVQGYFNLAVGYYENLYWLKPNAQNLYLLARTYDYAGDLDQA